MPFDISGEEPPAVENTIQFDASLFRYGDEEQPEDSAGTNAVDNARGEEAEDVDDAPTDAEALAALENLDTVLAGVLEGVDEDIFSEWEIGPTNEDARLGAPNAGPGQIDRFDVAEMTKACTQIMYPHLCSHGDIGNCHTNETFLKVEVVEDFVHSEFRALVEPQAKIVLQLSEKSRVNALVGVQMYMSHLCSHFLKTSRNSKLSRAHSTLLSNVDSLFTPLPPGADQFSDKNCENNVRQCVYELQTLMNNAIERTRYTPGHHVRVEQLFAVDDIHNSDVCWVSAGVKNPMTLFIEQCRQVDTLKMLGEMKESFFDPLSTIFGGVGDPPRDYSVHSPEVRTSTAHCVETSLSITDNVVKVGPITKLCQKKRIADKIVQPPLEFRTGLTRAEKDRTGLKYGLLPHLIPATELRNSQGTSTRRSGSGYIRASTAARLRDKIRHPSHYIEGLGRIMDALHSLARCLETRAGEDSNNGNVESEAVAASVQVEEIEEESDVGTEDQRTERNRGNVADASAPSETEGSDDEDERLPEYGFYETPNYKLIANSRLEDREDLYRRVVLTFHHLYNTEWRNAIDSQIKKHWRQGVWEEVELIERDDAIPACMSDLANLPYPNTHGGKNFHRITGRPRVRDQVETVVKTLGKIQ